MGQATCGLVLLVLDFFIQFCPILIAFSLSSLPFEMQSSFVGTVRAFQPAKVAVASRPTRVASVLVENRVSLRFQRGGRKHVPFFRLVAIDSKARRDGKPLEYLGCATQPAVNV